MAGTPPEPLSAEDAAILGLESSAIAGHTLKLVVLEPGDEPLAIGALRHAVAGRLDAEPRARERIELGGDSVASAAWVEDDAFDVAAHVRDRGRPGDGGDRELWTAAAELMGEHLDHRRPLWTFDRLGPLADGREALVIRIHHAMADGIGCVRFMDAVLWDEAAGDGAPAPRATRSHPEPRSRLAELRHLPGAMARELAARAPSTPLDRLIGRDRALAFVAFPLAALKRVGESRPTHVTVNDVLLATVAGGLREWLAGRGVALQEMRAQIPVSLHHRDPDPAELGNRDSFLNVDLPLAEAEPLAVLDRINAETTVRKQLGDAEEVYDFFHAVSRFHPAGRVAERLLSSSHEFSLSISNVPGPRRPVRVLGRRVERLFSVAEPADHHALRVSAISCDDALGVGLCTDPEAVPGVAELAAEIEASFARLRDAAA